MPDYQAMYLLLFNAITDALHDMEHSNFGVAAERRNGPRQKPRNSISPKNNKPLPARERLLFAQ